MDPSVKPETAAHYDREKHMRTPVGMISGMHIEAFMTELHAQVDRYHQLLFLATFDNVYNLNDDFRFETSLMLHLDLDAPFFTGAGTVGFTIDVFKDADTPVPLECAPGHVIEVYGQWKSKIEEWLAAEKPCPLTREMQLKFDDIPVAASPPTVNPYANGDKQ